MPSSPKISSLSGKVNHNIILPSFRPVVYLIIFSLNIAMLILVSGAEAAVWQSKSSGIRENQVSVLAVSALDAQLAFAGTKNAIYKTSDGGRQWQEVFRPSGSLRKINYLFFEPGNEKTIYAATDNGVFASKNEGKNWHRIFEEVGNLENIGLGLALYEEKIYLATRKGLFFSLDQGKTWQRASGIIGTSEISCVALNKDMVYLAAADGVYKSPDNAKSWEKIFSVSISQAAEATQDFDFEVDEELNILAIRFIAIDPDSPENIYLATNRGIFFSQDSGKTWQRLISDGLTSSDIRHIFISFNSRRIFCASKNGVFEFRNKKWEALYQGLTANQVNFISGDSAGNIWLATEKGVFKSEEQLVGFNPAKEPLDFTGNFRDEPSIREIQKIAIEYAEVSPNKIKNWRRQAQMKAFMPEVSVDFDRTVTTALGSGYDRTQIGPQDWGINLKWDVSELIWNNDQTSIDSRSKLMVELRDDILNEVTRLYFERRRLQVEMVISPSVDKKEEIDKRLRLDELTASIDALTGGYLSEKLERNQM